MNRLRENIEVAIRVRPLNTFENKFGQETAWECKKADRKIKTTLGNDGEPDQVI